jgi:YggT family protein
MAAQALIFGLVNVLAKFLSYYSLILIVRVLLSWFPNLDWSNPVLSAVASISDPFLGVFRGLIPPIGGLDLSAIVALLSLQLVQGLLEQSLGLLASASGF